MDPDFFFRTLRERLNPHLLSFLIASGQSVGIHQLTDERGDRVQGVLTVLFDPTDVLTVYWDDLNPEEHLRRGQHYHLCPDALRSYWTLRSVVGRSLPVPRALTYSGRVEEPFICSHLGALRHQRRSLIDAHSARACMLPGPVPTGPRRARPPPLILPQLPLTPTALMSLRLAAGAHTVPYLLRRVLADHPTTVASGEGTLDLSTENPSGGGQQTP